MNYSQNFTISGLQTLTIVVPVAGALTLSGKLSLPIPSLGAAAQSQVVTTIKQNGSTIFTSSAGQNGFTLPVLVAAQDSLSVQLTSSLAEDEVLNAVNGAISIG